MRHFLTLFAFAMISLLLVGCRHSKTRVVTEQQIKSRPGRQTIAVPTPVTQVPAGTQATNIGTQTSGSGAQDSVSTSGQPPAPQTGQQIGSTTHPAPNTSIQRPRITAAFREQIARLLTEAEKTDGMTNEGVNYRSFDEQVATVRGAFGLAASLWPADVPASSREEMQKAIDGWNLVIDLWYGKIRNYDEPTEPDINGFQRYATYAGGRLHVEVHDPYYIVPEYRGRRYLPFDRNIGARMSVAHDHYVAAKPALLQLLQAE